MSLESEKTKKRILKNPIKFSIQLNEEQKEAKSNILNHKITVLRGQAGSGKSLLAVQTALDLFFRHEFEKNNNYKTFSNFRRRCRFFTW